MTTEKTTELESGDHLASPPPLPGQRAAELWEIIVFCESEAAAWDQIGSQAPWYNKKGTLWHNARSAADEFTHAAGMLRRLLPEERSEQCEWSGPGNT